MFRLRGMGIVVETSGAEGETQGTVVGSGYEVNRVTNYVVQFNVFCHVCQHQCSWLNKMKVVVGSDGDQGGDGWLLTKRLHHATRCMWERRASRYENRSHERVLVVITV